MLIFFHIQWIKNLTPTNLFDFELFLLENIFTNKYSFLNQGKGEIKRERGIHTHTHTHTTLTRT